MTRQELLIKIEARRIAKVIIKERIKELSYGNGGITIGHYRREDINKAADEYLCAHHEYLYLRAKENLEQVEAIAKELDQGGGQ